MFNILMQSSGNERTDYCSRLLDFWISVHENITIDESEFRTWKGMIFLS